MRSAIAAMGTGLGPGVLDACRALFDDEQRALAARQPAAAIDLAYGAAPRQRLDIYASAGAQGRPVLVFVHGGGFLKGDKGSDHAWPNASVGRMAASMGLVGAVINYRLAPEHPWPAGAEDVVAAVDWLHANVAAFGGDPAQFVLMGTSAGAVHVCGALAHDPALAVRVRGAVLLSGLYGFTPLDERDTLYYGDPALYPARMPRAALVETTLPLLVACAQFDPPRFQAEFLGLLTARLERHGAMPRAHFAGGHNHYSMAMHLGTADRALAAAVASFIADCCD
ncbi:alpha/beta hydrolase [Novosphingobium sp.]|uniref:alpha/beta hydrolase n=1 Tax=Novosphingobium sp. TaxID=1874826 RepID=UPI0025D3FB23|nr:alpha/beta hydrolase [Novosphingobium sp.]